MSKPQTLSFVLAFAGSSIDREASLAAAEAALDSHIAQSETTQATIADAVTAVFDEHKGVNLTMPTIQGMALRRLNPTPATYKVYGELVLNYVRANADQKGEAPRTRLFGIQKGKNGGVCRWSDVPEKSADDSSDSK